MGIKSTVTYKWTCPPKRERFHTKSQQLMGEKVDGTIEERNLQSLWLIKHVLGPVIHTSTIPVLGKRVTNTAAWIVDLQDYMSLIQEIMCRMSAYSNMDLEDWVRQWAGSMVQVSFVLSKKLWCLFHSCTLSSRDHSCVIWIAGCSQNSWGRTWWAPNCQLRMVIIVRRVKIEELWLLIHPRNCFEYSTFITLS